MEDERGGPAPGRGAWLKRLSKLRHALSEEWRLRAWRGRAMLRPRRGRAGQADDNK